MELIDRIVKFAESHRKASGVQYRPPLRGVFVRGGKQACVYDADDRLVASYDVPSFRNMMFG